MHSNIFSQSLKQQNRYQTPIWLMRQAGRYMADYRRIREKYTLLEMVKNPEIACAVTMQPINAFELDAAIIFADILPLLEGMGLQLEFIAGEGPKIVNPVHALSDIENLRITPANECLAFTLEAIRLTTKELAPKNIPLIGFSGAPFTLASYAIEGGSSKNLERTKKLMYSHPRHWHLLMDKLSTMVSDYLLEQAKAGVQALQIFDSWAGALSPFDYSNFVLPHLKKIIDKTRQSKLPLIYFSTGTNSYLELIKQLDVDVFSVDWRINLNQAWPQLDTQKSLQGNLDPLLLMAPWETLKEQALKLLEQAQSIHPDRRGYIFNLGHGILPQTPEDNVKRLVELVKNYP